MIRVMIAEDQGMMRDALALLLGLEDDLEIVAQVSSGDEIVPAARSIGPTWRCSTSSCPAAAGSTYCPCCVPRCRSAWCWS